MIKIKFGDFLDKISEEVINNNKKITLFIGSGFSVWYGYPSWNSLFYDFCSKILSEDPDKKKYLDDMIRKVKDDGYHIPIAFDEVINELGLDKNYLREFLLLYFGEIDRTNRQSKFSFPGIDLAKYELLFELSKYCKIITTNFDTLIEDIIKEKFDIDLQVLYSDFEKLKSSFFSKDNNNHSILKLHGDVNRKETLILSEKDYSKIRIDKEYKLVRQALKDNFASEINIFIGYSLSDENIKELLIDNQDVYGNDKEKSYIINSYGLIELFLKEQRLIKKNNSYDALGVDEIYISSYDELFTILRFITNIYEIKQNLNKEVSRNYSSQKISKDHDIWEQTCFAINLFNSHLNQAARNVLENIIEKYDGEKETNWAFIYGLIGTILTSYIDEQIKLEGEKYISKAIGISSDKDSIYYDLGNFHLVNSVKETYISNISDNLGIILDTNKESVEKALYYFNSIENKNEMVIYRIFLCKCRNGNLKEALEMGYRLLEGNIPDESLYMEMGFIYYRLAMKITDEAGEEKSKYLIECTKFLEEYINTDSFVTDKPNNKRTVLERSIQCMNQIGEYDKAKAYCDKLIKLEPTSSELHMSLIEIYIYQNEYDKGVAECNYLINHTKSIGKLKEITKYIKAQCIFANAKYTHEVLEAIDLCKKVLEKGKFADVTYTISCMYQHIGRLHKMREYIVKSCYVYPLNDKLFDYAITLLGSSFPSEGDYFDFKDSVTKMEALRKHRKVFEENIIGDESKYYLYKHLNLKPKYPLKKIMIIDNISFKEFIFGKINVNIPDDVKVDIEEAFNCYNKKEYKIAIETLSKYKDSFDSNHIFKYVYANSLSNLKEANNAIPIYEEIIKDYMNCYDNTRQKLLYFYFGDCFFEINDYSKAYGYYVKALELDENFSNAIFKIAHSLFNLSKVSDYEYDINLINQSKYYFEKYIEYEEYDWEAYTNLEYIYSILGEFEKLIEIAKRWINYSLPYDILLEFYNYLIQGNLMLENDIDAKTYIDSAEGMIVNNIREFRNKHNLYQFFTYKGIYYANYSYETSVKSFKRAYEFSPTDENKICFESNIEPGRTFYLENDFKTIIRGGERYRPEQKN